MSKLIELVQDVWEFGCKGDVIKVTDEALAKLDKLGERAAGVVYKKYVDTAAKVRDAIEGEVVEPKGETTETPADTKTKA